MNNHIKLEDYMGTIHKFANHHRYQIKGYDKEDFVQDLYMAFLKCKEFYIESNNVKFNTYLNTALVNTYYIKRQWINKKYHNEIYIDSVIESGDVDIYTTEELKDMRDKTMELLQTRKHGNATIELLFNNKKKIDLAKELEISRPTLDKWHNDNLKFLKEYLE